MLVSRRRIELKRIADLIRQGLLREAARGLRAPEVRGHRDGCRLALRLVQALCDRAESHLQAGEIGEAIDDLQLAVQFASGDARLVALQRRIVEHARERAQRWLAEGAPERALELIDTLILRRIRSSDLDALRYAARQWLEGRRYRTHHRFNEAAVALERAQRIAPNLPKLESEIREVHELKARAGRLECELAEAYRERDWPRVRALAEELLGVCPTHGLAVAAKERARHELVGSLYAAARYERGGLVAVERSREGADFPRGGANRVWQVLIDGGGHYLLATAPVVVIGHQHGDADLKLLAPVGSRHARIERDREGYVLVPQRPVWVNGRQVVSPVPLRDGVAIELARGVGFTFRLPTRLSRTALLVPAVRSVFRYRLDAVVLAARVCVLGEGPDCHLFLPGAGRVTLVIEDESEPRFLLRAEGEFTVDGKVCSAEARFVPPARIELPSTRIVFAPA